VRTGLVVVGIAFLVLAGATVTVVNLLPSTTEVQDRSSLVPQPFSADGSGAALLPGADSASGSFTLRWSSTAAVSVWVYRAPGCERVSNACASGPAVANWTRALSGTWSTTGAVAFPFMLVWAGGGSGAGNISASGVQNIQVKTPMALVDTLVIDGAAIALGIVGAVALFLGLFLRGGVYPERRPTPASAPDGRGSPPPRPPLE